MLKNNSVGFPLTLALTAGLALPMAVADVVVTARPAVAAPVVAADLKDALLTVGDLPEGYSVIDFDPSEALAGTVDYSKPVGDPCAASTDLATDTPAPDLIDEPLRPIRPTKPEKPGKPGKHDKNDKHDKHDKPGKHDKNDKHGDPVKPDLARMMLGSLTDPEMAGAGFIKGTEGPILMETLVDAGRKQARALIADTEEVLDRCPDVETDTVRIEQEELRGFPKLGDKSVAISMVVTLKQDDLEISVEGRLAAFAVDDVYGIVVLAGMPEPSVKELKKIAKTAVRKLERA